MYSFCMLIDVIRKGTYLTQESAIGRLRHVAAARGVSVDVKYRTIKFNSQ